MTDHAVDPAAAFLHPDGVLVCQCLWAVRGLEEMRRHLADPEAGMPELLVEQAVEPEPPKRQDCAVPECERPARWLGFCIRHRQQHHWRARRRDRAA